MSARFRTVDPPPALVAFERDLVGLLDRHADRLTLDQSLAGLGLVAGQLIACRDPHDVGPDALREVVLRNLNQGFAAMAAHRLPTRGKA